MLLKRHICAKIRAFVVVNRFQSKYEATDMNQSLYKP